MSARETIKRLENRHGAGLRWREEHAASGSWWTVRTSHGTYVIDPSGFGRGFALDYWSATQPAGVQHFGQFPVMAAAKAAAEEHNAAFRRR